MRMDGWTGMLVALVVGFSVGLLAGWHIHRTTTVPVVADGSAAFEEAVVAQAVQQEFVRSSLDVARLLTTDLLAMREELQGLRVRRNVVRLEAQRIVAPPVKTDAELLKLARAAGFTKVVLR